ncbi:hypothetical protein VOLCADRAFT_98463 [Volvox carteri f. nagariensis]|uniref:Uncharacterized protein n=1 Tax=Volvox carteri f. nagariensis TaxID=3068 RepID=D8UFE5_VOLCA|nr:uncharacterized protein VOLCADRAFT_98463 [Volvox carteri f. nagariensis]EFJ41598.1 hypothetical protein VOLCADRAFT_98463 [Volvox carteri f. nagariensis]|eukprot:XP_002957389.1 hypothetical protein VOLCADRAFT_98463 [Volvox carteri f. nagariensis]
MPTRFVIVCPRYCRRLTTATCISELYNNAKTRVASLIENKDVEAVHDRLKGDPANGGLVDNSQQWISWRPRKRIFSSGAQVGPVEPSYLGTQGSELFIIAVSEGDKVTIYPLPPVFCRKDTSWTNFIPFAEESSLQGMQGANLEGNWGGPQEKDSRPVQCTVHYGLDGPAPWGLGLAVIPTTNACMVASIHDPVMCPGYYSYPPLVVEGLIPPQVLREMEAPTGYPAVAGPVASNSAETASAGIQTQPHTGLYIGQDNGHNFY